MNLPYRFNHLLTEGYSSFFEKCTCAFEATCYNIRIASAGWHNIKVRGAHRAKSGPWIPINVGNQPSQGGEK